MVPLPDPQLGTEVRAAFAEPSWAQWVKLNLEMTKSDGSLLKMEMLRHEDWVLENIDYQFLDEVDLKATSLLTAANSSQFLKSFTLEAPPVPLRTLFAELLDVRLLMAELEADSVLVTISLDLPEIGVRGEAVVTGVEPCPVILPGPGKVVLTTFHHASSHLIDLYLSPQPPSGANSPTTTYLTSTSNSATHPLTTLQTSEEALLYPQASRSSSMDPSWERIGVTGNHPIWSDDRHDYIAAMELRVGERLKNLSGDTVYVQQKLPRPGPTPVYNLEVQDEHVYYVGTNGVLAHNAGRSQNRASCPVDEEIENGNMSRRPIRHDSEKHHIASDKDKEFLPQFAALFGEAGLDLQSSWNLTRVRGHDGAHGKFYNKYILQRLRSAVTGKSGRAYREALLDELFELRREIQIGDLGNLLRAPSWD